MMYRVLESTEKVRKIAHFWKRKGYTAEKASNNVIKDLRLNTTFKEVHGDKVNVNLSFGLYSEEWD